MTNITTVAIVGIGYWGPNLVRNFSKIDNCQVKYVVDTREERLQIVQKSNPTVQTTTNYDDVINDSEVDAVAISTPVFSHYELAKKALQNGKHVLVEKPMTSTSDEAKELMSIAKEKDLLLMVDHTYLYTGAVKKIKSICQSGNIGKVKYIDSVRINLGLFQQDVNALWDLAPHDLSIISHLIDEKPYSINATGISHTNNSIENIAYLTVNYKSGLIVHITSSWSSPVKIRHMLIGGDKQMIVFNDLEPTEKVKVYDSGYDVTSDEEKRKLLIDYRHGDIYMPKISQEEALYGMALDFLTCLNSKSIPVSSSDLGLNVVQILESANKSLHENGKEIILN